MTVHTLEPCKPCHIWHCVQCGCRVPLIIPAITEEPIGEAV